VREKGIAGYHPWASIISLLAILTATIVCFHPAVAAVSLFAALLYGVQLGGGRALRYFLTMPLPVALFMLVANLLFVHRGTTVIAEPWQGHPITLEAGLYGICAALMTAAVLMWFYAVSRVLTGEKYTAAFGRILPVGSLTINMIMRSAPGFVRQAGRIADARKAMGCDGEKAFGKAVRTLSVMTTWALENSIETADSMKARGYGKKRRSSYSLQGWETRDLFLSVAAAVLCAAGIKSGIRWVCYPELTARGSVWGIMVFSVLFFLPSVIYFYEELQWRYYRSKI
jgi:energy-coupling factor transport system permease protein